jgi:hypothetical protein
MVTFVEFFLTISTDSLADLARLRGHAAGARSLSRSKESMAYRLYFCVFPSPTVFDIRT